MITPDELGKRITEGLCVDCGQPFTSSNVHTEAGWRETKISHLCEDCFDEVTAEPEDDEDEFDEAMMNCSQFVSDGVIHCGAIGSEPCDECPFHDEIGDPAPEGEDEDAPAF